MKEGNRKKRIKKESEEMYWSVTSKQIKRVQSKKARLRQAKAKKSQKRQTFSIYFSYDLSDFSLSNRSSG